MPKSFTQYLPSNLASAEIGRPAFSVLAFGVADGLQARVQVVDGVRNVRFLPARLADHVAEVVADVAVGVLKTSLGLSYITITMFF